MTQEEAIAVLAESKRQNEVMRDNPSTFWVSHQMADGVKNAERRIAALDMALTALRPVSREQVVKVWRGEWELVRRMAASIECKCPKCQRTVIFTGKPANFCEKCGSANTDEAVQMVMERLEALHENIHND